MSLKKNFMAIGDSTKEINVYNTYHEDNRLKLCDPLIVMDFWSITIDS